MSANISNDPAANAPDAAAYKGKGKAEDPSIEMSMDEDESESENEHEELVSFLGRVTKHTAISTKC